MGLSRKHILIAILTLSVLLRVAAALYLGDAVAELPGTHDQISYHNLALRVLDGHGFTFRQDWWPLTAAGQPTAHWSYLYTFYLVAVYALFGPHPLAARLIQVLLVGVLHPWLAYRLGERVFNARLGLISAGLTAVYIYFIYYAATLMTEPFYITAVLASLYLVVTLAGTVSARPSEGSGQTAGSNRILPSHRWALSIALGFTLTVAVLLRQLFLLLVPFLFLWLAASIAKRAGFRALLRWVPVALLPLIILALAILPFSFYNYARFQRFVLLNTNAGYAFFWANHPVYGNRFQDILPPELGTYQDLISPELRTLDEAALDRALLQRGFEFVRQNPLRYALLSLSRIPVYFKFWPSPQSSLISNISRVLSFGIFWPFMLYGLLLSTRKPRAANLQTLAAGPRALLYLFIALYTGVHLLSWSLIRYRLPVDAVLLIFAALGCADLWDRISARRGPRQSTK